MSDHTLKHMRSEYFEGNGLSDKGLRRQWEELGSQSTRERAREMARAILQQPFEPKVIEAIEQEIRNQFHIFLP